MASIAIAPSRLSLANQAQLLTINPRAKSVPSGASLMPYKSLPILDSKAFVLPLAPSTIGPGPPWQSKYSLAKAPFGDLQ